MRLLIACLAVVGTLMAGGLLALSHWAAALICAGAIVWAIGWVERHRSCVVTRHHHYHRSPEPRERDHP